MNAPTADLEILEAVIQEIQSIYARWQAGEISQEDALFEIGDTLEKMPATSGDTFGGAARESD